MNRTVADPVFVKQTFKEAELYSAISTEIKNQATDKTSESMSSGVNTIALNIAFNKVLTPSLVETNMNQIIDGTYEWLNGDTEIPQFSVDVAKVQADITDSLISSATTRMAGLPACSYAQLAVIDVNNFDPFTVVCNPGVDSALLRQQYQELANSGDGLLGDSTDGELQFSAAKLTNEQGQNLFVQASPVATGYQVSKYLPFVFLLLIVLSALGLYKLADIKNIALKKLAIKLIVAGVTLTIVVVLTNFLIDKAATSINLEQPAIQQPITRVVNIMGSGFNRSLILFAGSYIVLGAIGIFWYRHNAHKKTLR
ncbi:hypothetical protein KC946_03175 [Candidatus Saccharibacteria bacterium]|nr:hypothetical protein [Candidatus Saccharibacteria bacterium]